MRVNDRSKNFLYGNGLRRLYTGQFYQTVGYIVSKQRLVLGSKVEYTLAMRCFL